MTVPALTAAECPLAYNPRRLECPAPGTPAPHSTRRRAERFIRFIHSGSIANFRACPVYRYGFVDVDVDVHAALAGWMHRVCSDLAGCYENPV